MEEEKIVLLQLSVAKLLRTVDELKEEIKDLKKLNDTAVDDIIKYNNMIVDLQNELD